MSNQTNKIQNKFLVKELQMSILETIERNEEGFLVNPADWNKEIAVEIAESRRNNRINAGSLENHRILPS